MNVLDLTDVFELPEVLLVLPGEICIFWYEIKSDPLILTDLRQMTLFFTLKELWEF